MNTTTILTPGTLLLSERDDTRWYRTPYQPFGGRPASLEALHRMKDTMVREHRAPQNSLYASDTQWGAQMTLGDARTLLGDDTLTPASIEPHRLVVDFLDTLTRATPQERATLVKEASTDGFVDPAHDGMDLFLESIILRDGPRFDPATQAPFALWVRVRDHHVLPLHVLEHLSGHCADQMGQTGFTDALHLLHETLLEVIIGQAATGLTDAETTLTEAVRDIPRRRRLDTLRDRGTRTPRTPRSTVRARKKGLIDLDAFVLTHEHTPWLVQWSTVAPPLGAAASKPAPLSVVRARLGDTEAHLVPTSPLDLLTEFVHHFLSLPVQGRADLIRSFRDGESDWEREDRSVRMRLTPHEWGPGTVVVLVDSLGRPPLRFGLDDLPGRVPATTLSRFRRGLRHATALAVAQDAQEVRDDRAACLTRCQGLRGHRFPTLTGTPPTRAHTTA